MMRLVVASRGDKARITYSGGWALSDAIRISAMYAAAVLVDASGVFRPIICQRTTDAHEVRM